MRSLLMIVLLSVPALAQESESKASNPLSKTPALTADDVTGMEQGLRDSRPPPFLVRKDGTLFGVRPKAPADARLSEWLKFINRTVNPRSK